MWKALGRRIPGTVASVGISLALGLAVAAIPVATALAAPAATAQGAEPAATNRQESQHSRLETLYRLELRVLDRQERRLQRAGQVAERLEAFIQRQKDLGRDVSKLEEALAKFVEALESAKGSLATTRDILAAHKGFADDGTVVDAAQARETVHEAGKAERSVRQTMRQAYHHLQIALRQFRHANAPTADQAAAN